MPSPPYQRIHRVRAWLDAIRCLVDRRSPLGAMARTELPRETRLSPAGVQWVLEHALEVDASDEELEALAGGVPQSPTAHVLLSANVFSAALRAIAIGLASSERVDVRASRRAPCFPSLLHRAAPAAFRLVTQLAPVPGDHVWAYGADDTLTSLRSQLPAGTVLHGHGHGYGVLLVDAPEQLTDTELDAMAVDIAAFDQRGCLSPRLVVLKGSDDQARAFSRRLLAALERVNGRLPLGDLDASERAEAARHRELWCYLGEVFCSPAGTVSLDLGGHAWTELPGARTVHVRRADDALSFLFGLSGAITTVGGREDPALAARVTARLPEVRWSSYGAMQRPRLDGPADRRGHPRGLVI